MQKFFFSCLVATAVLGVFADDVYLATGRYTSFTQYLTTLNHWRDENGDPVSSARGADVNLFLPTGSSYLLTTSENRNNFDDFAMKSITAGVGTTFSLAAVSANSGLLEGKKERTLTIANPDVFLGHYRTGYDDQSSLFYVGGGQAQKIVLSDVSASRKLSHVSAATMATVEVPSGGNASVETVYGGGRFTKAGAGRLSVKRTDGSALQLEVVAGELELCGLPVGLVADAAVPGAALHLDASQLETAATYLGADGRTYLSTWPSAEEDGIGAESIRTAYSQSSADRVPCVNDPFISSVLSPSGLALVDFGSASRGTSTPYDATLGPSNCVMRLATAITGAKEVFIAYQRTQTTALFASALGSSTSVTELLPYGDTLFSGEASTRVKDGDIRLNGVPVAYNSSRMNGDAYSDGLHTFHIVSVKPTEALATSFDLLGSERYLMGRTGGMRIGEILVYTTDLTEDQRNAVNRYLRAKWLGSTDCEAGSALVASGTSLSVPEGRTAFLPVVRLTSGTTLVKNGAGQLVIGQIYPSDATIQVNAGSVKIGATMTYTDSAPAAGAYLWLDATRGSTLATEGGGVTRWNDCRDGQTSVYAEIPTGNTIWTNAGSEKPTVVADMPAADLSVVDYGTAGWMRVHPGDTDNARTGFVVVRFKESKTSQFGSPFGSSVYDCCRGTAKTMLSNSANTLPRAQAATFAKDGIVHGTTEACGDDDCEFHVYTISAGVKLRLDQIVKDRANIAHGAGNAQIGEFILYDRQLSIAERRATEKYLMKKWLGATSHPTEAAPSPKFVYGPEAPVVIDDESDEEIEPPPGGNGEIVKRGSGTVTTAFDGFSSMTDISVEEGRLVNRDEPFANAVFHFDADDEESLATEVVVDGDGAVRTNVVEWADCRANGLVATRTETVSTTRQAADAYPTNPVLARVEMPDGKMHNAVDFGPYDSNSGALTHFGAAAMDMSQEILNVRTVFAVQADNAGSKQQHLFSCRIQGNNDYYRGLKNNDDPTLPTTGYLVDPRYANANVYNGSMWINGEAVEYKAMVPDGFSLIEFETLGNTRIDAMCCAMRGRFGGLSICEQLAFSTVLPESRRQRIENILQNKWFGAALAPSFTLGNVFVAEDAALDFGRSVAVEVGCLRGAGTVGAAALTVADAVVPVGPEGAQKTLTVNGDLELKDGAVLEFGYYGKDAGCSKLVVDGTIGGADVTVRIANLSGSRVKRGEYELATISDVPDISGWTLVTRDFGSAASNCRLTVRDGRLYLTVNGTGTVLIVR